MKLELKMLESNDSSVAAIWKKKCLDLFEVCQTLKNENEDLRDRCKDLIEQGIQLTDAMNFDTTLQNVSFQSPMNNNLGSSKANVSLPKLLSNGSAQRLANQTNPINGVYQKANAATTALTTNRLGASTANTYELASNMGGYPIDDQSGSITVGGSIQRPQEALRSDLSPNYGSALDQEIPISASRLTGGPVGAASRHGNKLFTSTMGSAPGNNFNNTNQFSKVANGVVKTPQEQYMLGGMNVPGLNNKHIGHLPSTAHQQARNRSVGPGTAYQSTRPGQYTRQKPRPNVMQNGLVGNGGRIDLGGSLPRGQMPKMGGLIQGSEFVGDTSFNASFQEVSSLGHHPMSSQQNNRSLLHHQRAMNVTTAPTEKKRTSVGGYHGVKTGNKQAFVNAIRRQQALAGGQ